MLQTNLCVDTIFNIILSEFETSMFGLQIHKTNEEIFLNQSKCYYKRLSIEEMRKMV